MSPLFRWLIGAVVLLSALFSAQAGERTAPRTPNGNAPFDELTLLMVEEPGCPFCRRWRAEVGVGYAKSSEGRRAPLVVVGPGDPRLQRLAPIAYSPTFVLMRRDEEIGRIIGYPGPDFFWSMLAELLARAEAAPAGGAAKPI